MSIVTFTRNDESALQRGKNKQDAEYDKQPNENERENRGKLYGVSDIKTGARDGFAGAVHVLYLHFGNSGGRNGVVIPHILAMEPVAATRLVGAGQREPLFSTIGNGTAHHIPHAVERLKIQMGVLDRLVGGVAEHADDIYTTGRIGVVPEFVMDVVMTCGQILDHVEYPPLRECYVNCIGKWKLCPLYLIRDIKAIHLPSILPLK